MEAARVAAIRGHRVTLYEKRASLGGHLIEAAVPDFKADLKLLLRWYQNQLRNLRVEIKLGTEATESLITRTKPDIVIMTTGSQPIIPDIPGIQKGQRCILHRRASGQYKGGEECVRQLEEVCVGGETALWLAKGR